MGSPSAKQRYKPRRPSLRKTLRATCRADGCEPGEASWVDWAGGESWDLQVYWEVESKTYSDLQWLNYKVQNFWTRNMSCPSTCFPYSVLGLDRHSAKTLGRACINVFTRSNGTTLIARSSLSSGPNETLCSVFYWCVAPGVFTPCHPDVGKVPSVAWLWLILFCIFSSEGICQVATMDPAT